MRKIKQLLLITFTIAMLGIFAGSCKLVDDPDDPDDDSLIDVFLGWLAADENTENIEDDVNLDDVSEGDLPSSINLSGKFPPIGNQGAYGTCVAWATGYNHRSYINAVEKGYTTSDMQNANYTFSAKYLFWRIPSSGKGGSCNGTGFEPAYDIMLEHGIATESDVPYTDLSDCSGSATSWDSYASGHKLLSYREIQLSSLSTQDKIAMLKKYLAQKRAISFGAKLGENFMSWNSSGVLTDDTDTYNGQHAYHALILCGYDNSKGTNGAFRVVNSWGTNWGDNGYVWVDQNFFVDQFIFCAFVANSATDRDDGDDNDVDDLTSGKDVLAWELIDDDNTNETDETYRIARYNVFNSGNVVVNATEDWNILYLAVNATDANDFEIILYDYYSDDHGNYGDDGEITDGSGDGIENWYNHINIPAGKSAAEVLYGEDDSRFQWPYKMPNISGEYYLVLIADGYNALSEADEDNNYYWLKAADGGSITITGGVITDVLQQPTKKSSVAPKAYDKSPSPSMRSKKNLNGYTIDEIRALLKHRHESGAIKREAMEYVKSNKSRKTRDKR